MQKLSLILFFLALSLLQAEPYKVGAIYALTGPIADFGKQFQRGAEMYQKLQKSEHQIKLSIEDSKLDAATAVTAFHKLAFQDKVNAIHVQGSGPTLALKPLADKQNLLLIAAAAHPDILKESSRVIRYANLASSDAQELATTIAKLNPKKIAIIYGENEWAVSYHASLSEMLKEKIPKIELTSQSVNLQDRDLRPVLTLILKNKPEILVLDTLGAQISLLAQQARNLGFKGPIYVNVGLDLSKDAQISLRESSVPNIYWQHFYAAPKEFDLAYREMFNEPSSGYAFWAYNTLELIEQASAKVGYDAEKIASYLKSQGRFQLKYSEIKVNPDGAIEVPTVVEKFS